jgi:hypothetical protein
MAKVENNALSEQRIVKESLSGWAIFFELTMGGRLPICPFAAA